MSKTGGRGKGVDITSIIKGREDHGNMKMEESFMV